MANVNWCPSCQTVLANEQVISGLCERCDSEVEMKEMKQWFLRITDYADRLLDDLEDLKWPAEIKSAQKSWIGKSEGATFSFDVGGSQVDVFTTRPDTFFGVTYLVVAPEHPLLEEKKEKIGNWDEVSNYIQQAAKKSDRERQEHKEKTGVELKGVSAIHPATKEELPVWVSDYVLASYGSGAVMAVPAHDERDFEFAQKFTLPIQQVVASSDKDEKDEAVYEGEGVLINSGDFNDLSSEEAREEITKAFGEQQTTYRLRDWSIGRQRYWGTPIPVVYDPEGNPHPVPIEHLPWKLPKDVDHKPTGKAPLATSKELQKRTEEIFGEGWTPEIDTMDTFVDSSWYYIRYLDPHNDEEIADPEKLKQWMPVDFYSGGAEHTTLHLLYSRFFYKALSDLDLVQGQEPYKVRMNRGLILGPDGNKMSKSKGNVIDPDEQVEKVGADSVRAYLAFIGPFNEVGTYPWDMGGLAGVRRFLERVWRLQERLEEGEEESLEDLLHRTIQKVGEDIEKLKFNTALSALMEFVNSAQEKGSLTQSQYERLLILLSPFAPHITEELWHEIGKNESIHLESWPSYDPDRIQGDTATIAVQVDGKVRGTFEAAIDTPQGELEERAQSLPEVAKWIEGKQIERVICVPNRLVNIVTS